MIIKKHWYTCVIITVLQLYEKVIATPHGAPQHFKKVGFFPGMQWGYALGITKHLKIKYSLFT